jgi:hypothetical protein
MCRTSEVHNAHGEFSSKPDIVFQNPFVASLLLLIDHLTAIFQHRAPEHSDAAHGSDQMLCIGCTSVCGCGHLLAAVGLTGIGHFPILRA